MEIYEQAAEAVNHELEENGYEHSVGINRFTDTIAIDVESEGPTPVADLLPEIVVVLNEPEGDDGLYQCTLDVGTEEAKEFFEENYEELFSDDTDDEEED